MANKQETRKEYLERVNKVLIYINDHLEEKLDLATLSSIGHFSPFHFHRIMRAYIREPLYSYIQRIRLDKSAWMLLHSNDQINDISWKVGYESPASFSKAFSKRFGKTPVEFRENKDTCKMETHIIQINNYKEVVMNIKPKFKKLSPEKVIFIRSIGPYNGSGIENAWDKLCAFAQKNKLFGFSTQFIGISHDDPKITEADKLRYDACITVCKKTEPEGEIGYTEINGGNYATFRHTGPFEKLEETYDYIFGQWLPQSGAVLRDAPCLEKYVNDPKKTKPENLKTDIYVPIE